MANRSFTQFTQTLEKAPVDLFIRAAIGSTGAPTLNVAQSKGIKSLARTGTGAYLITLQDNYVRLLSIRQSIANATGISAAPDMGIISGSSNVSSSTAPVIAVQFSAAGSATELASGDSLSIVISLSNSTAP